MTKNLKLVGIEIQKVYYDSNICTDLQRWLDEKFGSIYSGVREKRSSDTMPEAMRIVNQLKR